MNLALFDHIPSQTTTNAKHALLASQEANRARIDGSFVYLEILEIGSHLGGSLQALVADPARAKIISIDPRPCKCRGRARIGPDLPREYDGANVRVARPDSREPDPECLSRFDLKTPSVAPLEVRMLPREERDA